jgi:hypothetical protein
LNIVSDILTSGANQIGFISQEFDDSNKNENLSKQISKEIF